MDGLAHHQDIRQALGAYALDAVDGDEAAAIEEHVRHCPLCAAELDEHRDVASKLANQGGDAPDVLWDRISARLQVPPGVPEEVPVPRLIGGVVPGELAGRQGRSSPSGVRRSQRRWRASAIGAIAAVAAVAIALLAVQVGRLDSRVGTLSALANRQSMPALAEQALADPQAQHVALVDSSVPGRTVADLVILPDGTAYLVESTLPPLPANQTYQLWGMVSGQAVSLGLLGSHPGVEAFSLDPDAPLRQFAVTAEPAGGVVISNHAPVAEGTVRST